MLPDFEISCEKFSQCGIELSREAYEKFDIYAKFLVEYNKKVNLTAITEPTEILCKHFIDSACLLKYVDIKPESTLIDVGTGAGFPSIPLKILRPDIKLTLLDSLNKRIDFLKQLCDKLDIHADFIHGRAEDFSKMPEYREQFDYSCARAVANLSTLSELCIPFVKVGGSFISMKGPSEDVSRGTNAIELLGGKIEDITDYSLFDEQRRIITVKKISQTPIKYPRNSAQIKKKEL
ncbi:16S rRNA (guanine(527)-N(7))-methyltransferase RsmG [Ruminococcus flavefaciens]|uniref:Ribosomal RNA small subunit methyltransferase G n=1 Tax=Ruminococcus flavefaciens TaxID=1265 RepID=A0A1K1PX74_RUMFL|nr:16S rRNA (guanine(527)-N(7))-methyltransferase RsmG [Ruminococcus flavefaciens]SFW52346.1 16S rRNA (guanine527-N7)-methyltransferase [Ruminococcus flavefaciens]